MYNTDTQIHIYKLYVIQVKEQLQTKLQEKSFSFYL